MAEFDKIYLAWRKGVGSRRHVVGLLERKPDNQPTFRYLPEARQLFLEEGFLPYFEFPDFDKVYDQNVVAIFAQRLMKPQRPDIRQFYEFWEVDQSQANDRFYLLGKTQGLVATDNFEFLAEYELTPQTHFLTDLAGLTHLELPRGLVKMGDALHFEYERANEKDPEAVKVFAGELELGYIKKVHCRVFHQSDADKLELTVKSVEQNGTIRKIYVRVAHKDLYLQPIS